VGSGFGSLVPVGSNFAVPCMESEASLPCLHPSLPPSPGNQQLQPLGRRELGLQNATSPSWRGVRQGRSCPPPHQGTVCPISLTDPRLKSPCNPQEKLPCLFQRPSCSPGWKRGGWSLPALRANSSHQLTALFPRAAALAAGSQLAGGYQYFMQTWRETSPVSHSQRVAPKQHRDLSQHICGICANWPDCLNNSVYIYKL